MMQTPLVVDALAWRGLLSGLPYGVQLLGPTRPSPLSRDPIAFLRELTVVLTDLSRGHDALRVENDQLRGQRAAIRDFLGLGEK